MLTLSFASGQAPKKGRKVHTWLDDCGQVFASAYSSNKVHWIDWLDLGVFAFSAGSHDVRVWPARGAQHQAVVDAFSCMIQPIILQALGWQALHAAAAVGPSGVLAFCGKSGSGKSTLAYAMQDVGCRQFADDALVLCFEHDRVTACELPFKPRLRAPSRVYFAHTHSDVSFRQHPAELPLSAVFLLQQEATIEANPRISLMSPARSFSEILAHAHCFEGDNSAHTRRLAEDYLALAARVPVFTLTYRPCLQRLPQLTEAVMWAAANSDANSSDFRPAALFP